MQESGGRAVGRPVLPNPAPPPAAGARTVDNHASRDRAVQHHGRQEVARPLSTARQAPEAGVVTARLDAPREADLDDQPVVQLPGGVEEERGGDAPAQQRRQVRPLQPGEGGGRRGPLQACRPRFGAGAEMLVGKHGQAGQQVHESAAKIMGAGQGS